MELWTLLEYPPYPIPFLPLLYTYKQYQALGLKLWAQSPTSSHGHGSPLSSPALPHPALWTHTMWRCSCFQKKMLFSQELNSHFQAASGRRLCNKAQRVCEAGPLTLHNERDGQGRRNWSCSGQSQQHPGSQSALAKGCLHSAVTAPALQGQDLNTIGPSRATPARLSLWATMIRSPGMGRVVATG